MEIGAITAPQVWAASSRSLTDIGSGALTPANTINTVIAVTATVDLRTSAGIVGDIAVAVVTGAAATAASQILITDGANPIQAAITAAAANAPIAFSGSNANTVGFSVRNNDGAVQAKYIVSQKLWTI